MRILLQSTAVVVQFGPFVDKTDGNTYETALAGTGTNQLENTTTGIRISKNGGALAARSATATASTYDALGMYLVTLSTTDTGTLGQLRMVMNNNDALTVWEDFLVVPANIYNSLVLGTDILDVSVTQLLGTAWLTPGVAGTPDVNAKQIGALAVVSGAIPNAVAGAASGLAIVGSSMVVPNTQKVDVETIKTQAVTCAAGVTVLPSVGAASAQTATLDTIKAETAGIEVHVHTTIPGTITTLQGNVTTILGTDLPAVKTVVDGIETHVHTTIPGLLPTALISGRIDASVGAVAAGAINNAGLNADIGSTAYATNIMALAVFKALDSAIGDAVSLTADGLLEKIRMLLWIQRNKIAVTDADGHTIIYKDNSTTEGFHTSAMLTDDLTTTTRLRATAV